jgi:hypothetical protein
LTGWTGGSTGNMYKTTNGGLNFYQQTIPVTGGFFTDIDFVNDSVGWAIDVFVILHTTNGGGEFIGINPLSNEIPSKYKLYQNFPNPFNSETVIKFDVSKAEKTKVLIFDVMGRKIETFLDIFIQPGTYEIRWNAENYSSGIYFYSLITNMYSECKKMILLK